MRNESGGPSQNPTSVDPSDWRKGVLDAWSILLAIPLGGGVAYSLAVNPVFSGSPWLRVPLMAAVAMVVASTARRLPYATRVGLLTLGLYILWSFNLLRSPYRPAEVAMGIAVVFTAAVLLPVRWAIATWLFSVATVVTIVLLVAAGGVPISVDPAAVDPRLPSAGLQIVIVHSMFAGAIGVATTLIVNRLSDSREATRAAESSLRIREAHWRSLLDNAADSIVTVTSDYWIEFLNHRVSGYGAEGAAVLRIGDLSPSDEEVSRRRAAVDRVFETGESVTLEADWVDREGVSHPWSMRFSPILKDGDVDRVAIISTDLSERRALEEQLRQSQKMQAVGELTGGLAHDFNNLLTVVMGNLELLMAELDDGAETRELAALALEAATRGAGITHRLLAFSRRQVLHPRVVDLAELTVGMTELIRSTLGQSIEVWTETPDGPLNCVVDAAQLENAILNLAINSRDAMPNGGTLTVSCFCGRLPAGLDATRDAEEIDYVLVSVTDTGEGIAEDLRSQVFDPFFTTKDIGEGSGLGLSMVQGLVAQSGGHVRIDTKVGSGTTVTLFFPRCEDEAEVTDAGATRGAIEGDGELILVLEDDPAVRSLSLRTLQRLGYRTLDASTARQALSIIRERDDIDLLFSDVVLPGGMSGVDLLGVLRQETPGLPVLFTSGFSTNQDTVMAELGVDVLAKPFNKATLSSALTHTLARQRPSSTAMHSPNVHAATGSSRAIRLLSTGPPPAPPSMAKLTRGDASTRLVESNGGALVARIPRGSPSPE